MSVAAPPSSSLAEGFEEFLLSSTQSLTRAATLLLANRADVEDHVQATYERVLRSWHRVSGDPLPYARRVLTNLVIDGHRRSRGRHLVALHDVSIDAVAHVSGELRLDLLRALQQLPPRRRAVVVLRLYLDMSEKAVAEQLGISRGAVKSALSRGLEQLRELMEVTS